MGMLWRRLSSGIYYLDITCFHLAVNKTIWQLNCVYATVFPNVNEAFEHDCTLKARRKTTDI